MSAKAVCGGPAGRMEAAMTNTHSLRSIQHRNNNNTLNASQHFLYLRRITVSCTQSRHNASPRLSKCAHPIASHRALLRVQPRRNIHASLIRHQLIRTM
jgi:hypothetical protein